jgi:CTP:molybdopterin cytidylyltransferase MocA
MTCAIVLAAGQSRRMGTQKLLLPLAGKPVLAHVVDAVLCSPVEWTGVVIRPDDPGLRQALTGRAVQFVVNLDPEGDMLSSVRCGLRALPSTCETIVVVLGDQPGLTADLIGRLLKVQHDSGRGLVLPTHRGKGGHPLVMAARFREEVLGQYDGLGLRGLLAAHPEEIREVAIHSGAVLEDLDEPADYERLRARFSP